MGTSLATYQDYIKNQTQNLQYFENIQERIVPFKILRLLKDAEYDEVKGIPVLAKFTKGIMKNKKFVLKIIPIETEQSLDNSKVEFESLRLFTDNLVKTKKCIHFPVLYHFVENTSMFNKTFFGSFTNELTELYDNLCIKRTCRLLYCEYIENQDIDLWLYNSSTPPTLQIWKVLIFQVVFSLAVLQREYRFVHNDFHIGNILIDKIASGGSFKYIFDNVDYLVPNIGIISKLWDFEFTKTFTLDNKQGQIKNPVTVNGGKVYNPYSDIHFFMKEMLTLEDLPTEVVDFVYSLYPKELLEDGSDMKGASEIHYSNLPETQFLKHGKLKPETLEVYLDLPIPDDILKSSFFLEFKTGKEDSVLATFKFC